MTQRVEPSLAEIQALPKIDLHRHLLGCARPETLWELARKYDLDVGRQPLDKFARAIVHRKPVKGLPEYIRPWLLFREIIRNPEEVGRIAFEAAVDAREDQVKYVEFRSSLPGLPITAGSTPQTQIPVDEYLHAIRDAFSRTSGIDCRLIASVPRHWVGQAEPSLVQLYAEGFLDAVARFGDGLVVGVDLTGIESGWPASLFKGFFAQARSVGLPVTIHAGETEGPEEIWAAIDELGASRIGHGTSAPIDGNLVKELIRRKITLEVCPTTSWLIGSAKERLSQPIIEHVPPIPYVICTDNPIVNASVLSDELFLAAQILGVPVAPFLQSQYDLAASAAFAASGVTPTDPGESPEQRKGVHAFRVSPISAHHRAKT